MKKLLTLLLAVLLLCSFSLTMISCDSDDGESSSSSGDNNPPATTKTFTNDYFSFRYPSSFSQIGEDNGANLMLVDMTTGANITVTYNWSEEGTIDEIDLRTDEDLDDLLDLLKAQFGEDAISDYQLDCQKTYFTQTFTVVQAGITMYMTTSVTYSAVDEGVLMLNFTIADMDASRPVASTVLQ